MMSFYLYFARLKAQPLQHTQRRQGHKWDRALGLSVSKDNSTKEQKHIRGRMGIANFYLISYWNLKRRESLNKGSEKSYSGNFD